MPAAIIGGAIAGVGAIGAAAIGSSAQKKASDQATQAAQDSTAQNAALFREARAENMAVLSPFVARGNVAGNQINALLGLGGAPASIGGGAVGGVAGTMPQQQLPALQQQQVRAGTSPALSQNPWVERDPMSFYGQDVMTVNGAPVTAAQQGQTAQQAANDAFNIFKNSTGYQFRVSEGQNALNSGFAGSGLLQSGAALKALDDYRQNMASNEVGNYISYLGNQQGVGLSGASAVAGVSQNFANNMASQNNAMASVIANSALAQGQGSAQLWGGVGNALGQFGGVIAGRG